MPENATITLYTGNVRSPVATFDSNQWGTALDIARRSALETQCKHTVVHVAPDGLRTVIYFSPVTDEQGRCYMTYTGAYQTREEEE